MIYRILYKNGHYVIMAENKKKAFKKFQELTSKEVRENEINIWSEEDFEKELIKDILRG